MMVTVNENGSNIAKTSEMYHATNSDHDEEDVTVAEVKNRWKRQAWKKKRQRNTLQKQPY